MYTLYVLLGVLATACAQSSQRNPSTTPVPILKQINTHNDDGSYTYGYEGADGSFKIETKYANGEVHGKYGYVGDDGKVREIEYGASRRGFEPAGSDINVPPPVLANNELDYDDGSYKDDPDFYNEYKNKQASRKIDAAPARNVLKNAPRPQQAPARFESRFESSNAPSERYEPVPAIRYSSPAAPNNNNQYDSAPSSYYNPAPAPQNYYNPTPAPQNYYNPPTPAPYRYQPHAHPQANHAAANVNLHTGSYSLSYVG